MKRLHVDEKIVVIARVLNSEIGYVHFALSDQLDIIDLNGKGSIRASMNNPILQQYNNNDIVRLTLTVRSDGKSLQIVDHERLIF